jgi:hypothetical protein
MKKFILLFIIFVFMSGCYVEYRTPYYQKHSNYQQRIKSGKIYKPYFRPGRY